MLASRRGALDPLTREQNDLLALQPLGRWDQLLERGEKRIFVLKDPRIPRSRPDVASTEIFKVSMRAMIRPIILLGPLFELPHQFHMVVTCHGNPVQIFFKSAELLQSPDHDGKLRAALAMSCRRLSGFLGREGARSERCRGHADKGSASEHALHGSRVQAYFGRAKATRLPPDGRRGLSSAGGNHNILPAIHFISRRGRISGRRQRRLP